MKKIAIVANSTWNIYNFRLHLIKQLQSQGYRVIIITPIDEFLPFVNKEVSILHIPLLKLSPQSQNPFNDLSLIHELYNIYKKEKLDLILHYTIKPNIFGSIAARWADIPSISTVTGLGYTFLKQNTTKNLIKLLYKFALKDNYKVIFHNNDDKNLFIQKNIINPNHAMVIKGSGVDTNFFRPSKRKEKQNQFIFLFIGRLLYDKGIIEYLAAAKKIKQYHEQIAFWVIGSLDAKNPSAIPKEIINKAVESNHIKYLGTTKDIKLFIQNIDVLVLPSYREGMPKVILEGMSMGKPIITTDTAGCREAIEHNVNGYLVPIKNIDALTDAMIKIFSLEKKVFYSMAKSSREKALAEFDKKIINNQYINLVRDRIG